MTTAATVQTSIGSRVGRLNVLAGTVVIVVLAAVALLVAGCSDLVSRAQDAESAGDLKTAEALYQEQLQSDPDDLSAIKGLAGILYMERRWNEALPVQQKATTLDAREAQIRVELGFNYLNHQDAPANAVAALLEACALEPTAQYFSFLAQAQVALDDRSGAETSLRRAVEADKMYGRAYALLISLLEEDGKTAEAAEVRATADAEGVSLESPVTTS